MKDPKVSGTKVIFGPCRLAYTHLFEKYPAGDPNASYMSAVLIPKSEKKTVAALNEALKAAAATGVGGKPLKSYTSPLRDGDDKDGEEFNDHYYINPKSKRRPGIVDKAKNPITDEDDVYSGMWAYVSVTAFTYDRNGNKGVSFALNNIMKYKDDDHFDGHASAESDFSDIIDDDDEEL